MTLMMLLAENAKLRQALSDLIPWAGANPDGPTWATPEAKTKNRKMFEDAFRNASDCFPEFFNGFTDSIESPEIVGDSVSVN